jgi:hypothetical protein
MSYMSNSAKSMVSSREPRFWEMEQRLTGLVPIQLEKYSSTFMACFAENSSGWRRINKNTGGGYASPFQNMHSGLRWHFHQLLSAANKDVGILILAYGVSFTLSATLFVLLTPIDLIPTAQYRNASGQGHSTVNFPVRNAGGRSARLLIYTVTPI